MKPTGYKPNYFHQIVCHNCGVVALTVGFTINNKLKIAKIEVDCPNCQEPILGLQVTKEQLQFIVGSEFSAEKLLSNEK
jgi:hypothetical protein